MTEEIVPQAGPRGPLDVLDAMDPREHVSLPQAARIAGVSERTMYEQHERGFVECHCRRGTTRGLRVSVAELKRWYVESWDVA
jgi:hypothetical protein